MKDRNKFTFFKSYWESINLLTSHKHKSELISAICSVQFGEKLPENIVFSHQLLQMAWLNIKPILKQSLDGYSHKNKGLERDPSQGASKGANKEPTEHKEKEKEKEKEKDKTIVENKDSPQRIPYKKIVDFLNQEGRVDYKHTTNETRRLIKARFNAGFTEEDFKSVIKSKVAEWLTDDKMVQYIRPSTLFGTKFESYLQAADTHIEQTNLVSLEVMEASRLRREALK